MVKIVNGPNFIDIGINDHTVLVVLNNQTRQPNYTRYTQFKNATIHIINGLQPDEIQKVVEDNKITLTIYGKTYSLKKLEFDEFEFIHDKNGSSIVSCHEISNNTIADLINTNGKTVEFMFGILICLILFATFK